MFGEGTITFRGKPKVFKFNLNAHYLFCQLHGLTEEQMSEYVANPLNVTTVRDMIFCSLLAADSAAGNVADYNLFEVGEWMSEAGIEELSRVLEIAKSANVPDKALKSKKK